MSFLLIYLFSTLGFAVPTELDLQDDLIRLIRAHPNNHRYRRNFAEFLRKYKSSPENIRADFIDLDLEIYELEVNGKTNTSSYQRLRTRRAYLIERHKKELAPDIESDHIRFFYKGFPVVDNEAPLLSDRADFSPYMGIEALFVAFLPGGHVGFADEQLDRLTVVSGGELTVSPQLLREGLAKLKQAHHLQTLILKIDIRESKSLEVLANHRPDLRNLRHLRIRIVNDYGELDLEEFKRIWEKFLKSRLVFQLDFLQIEVEGQNPEKILSKYFTRANVRDLFYANTNLGLLRASPFVGIAQDSWSQRSGGYDTLSDCVKMAKSALLANFPK